MRARAAPAFRSASAAACVSRSHARRSVSRQMRPWLMDLVELVLLDAARAGTCRGPTTCASWMMPRYMSTMYIVPSGAVAMSTGRKSGSVDWMNSFQRIDVAQLRQPLGDDRPQPADDAPDRLRRRGSRRRDPPAADRRGRCRCRAAPVDAVERAVGHADRRHAALHVGDADGRAPRDVQVRLELIGHVEVAVDDRELEVGGHAAGAALEPHLAVVVLGHAPLRAVATRSAPARTPCRRPAQRGTR